MIPASTQSSSAHLIHRLRMAPMLLALLLWWGCYDAESNGGGPGEQGPGQGIAAVEVVRATSGALPLEERLTGTVRADNQVIIYPEISAPVVRVVAENGDYVRQGQPLVYLRDTQFRDELRQAEASLQITRAQAREAEAAMRELRSRLERTKELAEKQFQSQQELQSLQAQFDRAEASFQQAEARIDQAEATVDQQKEALRRTVVQAPISGHVGQRNVEPGMRVDPGTQLFIMGDLSSVRVRVAITDRMLGRIETGQTALISAENMGEQYVRGEISRISPFLQSGSFSAEAEIDVENDEGLLRPGMFVMVDVHYGESRQATLVPMSALYEDPNSGETGVYVAPQLGEEVPMDVPDSFDAENPPPLSEPTIMVFKPVTVLAQGREMAGVQGVGVGEWVVTVGQNLLSVSAQEDLVARARPVPWNRVVSLQRLQDQDLLREFMAKQQRLAHDDDTTSNASSTGGSGSSAR